ncbi:hypothetical protein T492DRAFT_1141136 [Pavlovales sp. CCMP2436]|nr:hypothetical protein T492DRAFT_1141136 [Pavlovales sp. CCMP2436]
MALLTSLSAAESTLVIFMSDNGPYLEEGYANSCKLASSRAGRGRPSSYAAAAWRPITRGRADSTALLRRWRFPSRARWKSYKLFWATQRWPSATTANASAIGVYDASVCTECCPESGWSSGLFGAATVCQCSPEALEFHVPPLVFDMSNDRNETTPIPSNGELYAQVVR